MSGLQVIVYHLVTPLARTYHLPFGPLESYDSFVAVARHPDGRIGLGETMPLPGYSHEDARLVDSEHARLARDGDLEGFLSRNSGNPFVTSAITSALDRPVGSISGAVRLCPVLQYDSPAGIEGAVQRLALAGATTAKVKIGPSLREALTVIARTMAAGRSHGMRFRYDANQTLDRRSASAILDVMESPGVELLEQPLPAADWEGMMLLKSRARVPLMLDEAIVDGADVERAAGCADVIKLKLAKNGSLSVLLGLIKQARGAGLDVVLGNGAQGSIGCFLEAQAHRLAGLTRSGEMNGWLKIAGDPLGFLLERNELEIRLPEVLDAERVVQALESASSARHAVPGDALAPSLPHWADRGAPPTPGPSR